MEIRPPCDKLIIELLHEETVTDSGIVLTTKKADDYDVNPHDIFEAEVKFVGDEVTRVKKGDRILIEQCYTRPFKFRDMVYKIIKESDMVGVINEQKRESISNVTGREDRTASEEGNGDTPSNI